MKLLERWGIFHINRYLQSNSFLLSYVSFQHVTKAAVILSFMIGFLITLLIVAADILLFPESSGLIYSAKYFLVLGAINIGLISIEFWLLFHIGFQAIVRYINEIKPLQSLDRDVKASLVRAVLELNEPVTERFGLNPYRRKKKHYWFLLVLYKIKVVLSNAVAKIITRKLLSRMGLRTYAPLISTIITGWWDAWVQQTVLKEARFRLSGRMYSIRLINTLKEKQHGSDYLEALIRLVAVRVELFGLYNINLDYLIIELERHFPNSVSGLVDSFDINLLKNACAKLSVTEKNMLADAACNLLAFKRTSLSRDETELLNLFNINRDVMKSRKQSFNELLVSVHP